MDTIIGNYASAVVYASDIEDYARAQIKMICDNVISTGSNIRIMPDCHPGKVGPIGLTMTVNDRILPVIEDTVAVKEVLKPVYNFKAGKER